ncbi:hypothetical protein DMUE_3186 [Dictyocoela muelleri]|nr:hypothetical protein DMUE_3186 [Dictyocoela muelleri]
MNKRAKNKKNKKMKSAERDAIEGLLKLKRTSPELEGNKNNINVSDFRKDEQENFYSKKLNVNIKKDIDHENSFFNNKTEKNNYKNEKNSKIKENNKEIKKLIDNFLNIYDKKNSKFESLREYGLRLDEYTTVRQINEKGILSLKQRHYKCEKRRTDFINNGIKVLRDFFSPNAKKSRGLLIMEAIRFILQNKILKKD